MIEAAEARLLENLDRDELTRVTQALVRIDSVIRPESGGTERNVVRFVADWIHSDRRRVQFGNRASPATDRSRVSSG